MNPTKITSRTMSVPGVEIPVDIKTINDREAYLGQLCRLIDDGKTQEEAELLAYMCYAQSHPERFPLRVVFELGAKTFGKGDWLAV